MKKVIVLLLVAIIGGAAFVIYQSRDTISSDRIVLSGNIELSQVNIAFKTAGRLMERTVDEGDKVAKGQVIARLDREQLIRQRQREVAALAGAEAQLRQAQMGLQFQTQTLEADMEARQADVRSAEARLLELKNGARPEEIQEAKASVAAAQAEYERARRDWDRAQALHKNDDISTSQFDASRTKFDSAEAMFKQARERASLVLAGARSEQITAAHAQLQRARAGVKASEAGQLDLQRRQEEIAGRQAEINRARAQIALTDSQISDTIAVSPINGLVLVKSADPGEVLAPGTSIVTIGDLSRPWLRAYINAKDLGRVRIGSKARVTTDAFPGKSYEGRVSFISSDAEFTPKQIQTTEERVKLVYRVKIDVDNPQQELKSNMPADAEILLGN